MRFQFSRCLASLSTVVLMAGCYDLSLKDYKSGDRGQGSGGSAASGGSVGGGGSAASGGGVGGGGSVAAGGSVGTGGSVGGRRPGGDGRPLPGVAPVAIQQG